MPEAWREPSSSITTTRLPIGFEPSSTSQPVITLSWRTPGSSLTAGLAIEKPLVEATAPVATITASAPKPITSAAVAALPRSTTTPSLPRRSSRSLRTQPNVSRPGVFRIRLTWPPSSADFSQRVTLWPRLASTSAAFMPAGPPPTTRNVRASTACRSVP